MSKFPSGKTCDACGKKFKTFGHYLRHYNKKHRKILTNVGRDDALLFYR